MIIKSKCGKYDILVDDEDYQKAIDFAPFGWEVKYTTGSNNPYVYTRKTIDLNGNRVRKGYLLHRLVMNVLDDRTYDVDHILTNTLDNRKSELRLVTKSQNSKNRTSKKTSACKFLGVSYCNSKRGSKKYRVNIADKFKYKGNVHLGYYYDEDSAGYAYNVGAEVLHGKFAKLNNINISNVNNSNEINDYVINQINNTNKNFKLN